METIMKTTFFSPHCLLAALFFLLPAEHVMAAKKSRKKFELAANSKKISGGNTGYTRDENKTHREDKRYAITATPIGIGAGLIAGLNAGYYVEPDLILGAKIENHTVSLNILGMDLYKANTKRAGVFGKYFFGKSFYLDGGLVGNIAEYTANGVGLDSSNGLFEIRQYEKWHHGGIDLAIGNQWHWDHFTLGADWIGLYQPLVKQQVKDENDSPSEEYMEDIPVNLGHVRILAFHLGLSF